MDSQQARFIGAEAAKMTTSSIRISKHYWEKIASTTQDGQRAIRYKIFSVATMPESDFKTAVMAAVRKQQGKSGLSEDFAQKVNQHWDSFVNGSGSPSVPTPAPASETTPTNQVQQ